MFRCRSYNSYHASLRRLLVPLKCCSDLSQQGVVVVVVVWVCVVALSFALTGCAEMLTEHSRHLAGVFSMPVANASGLAEGLPCSQPLSQPRAAIPHLQLQWPIISALGSTGEVCPAHCSAQPGYHLHFLLLSTEHSPGLTEAGRMNVLFH